MGIACLGAFPQNPKWAHLALFFLSFFFSSVYSVTGKGDIVPSAAPAGRMQSLFFLVTGILTV